MKLAKDRPSWVAVIAARHRLTPSMTRLVCELSGLRREGVLMTSPLSNTLQAVEHAVPCLPATRNGEESDNYPNLVARLGDVWRIIECRDGIQWILQRRAGKRHGQPRWEGRYFCRTRDGLAACVRELVGPEAVNALGSLPAHIERRVGA